MMSRHSGNNFFAYAEFFQNPDAQFNMAASADFLVNGFADVVKQSSDFGDFHVQSQF